MSLHYYLMDKLSIGGDAQLHSSSVGSNAQWLDTFKSKWTLVDRLYWRETGFSKATNRVSPPPLPWDNESVIKESTKYCRASLEVD